MLPIFKRLKEKRQQRFSQLREEKRQELFLRIQKVTAEELEIADTEKIKINTRFKEDLGADSLDSIELVMGLEREFDLEVEDAETEKFLTVKDVVNYLEDKV